MWTHERAIPKPIAGQVTGQRRVQGGPRPSRVRTGYEIEI